MNREIIWPCHKVDGKLKLYDQAGFKRLVASMPEDGLELILRKEKSKRSRDQRAYYWAVMVAYVSEFMGEEKDAVNEILKLKFNPKPSKDFHGNPITIGGSFEKEPVAEVERIYEEIRAFFAVEFNLIIPLPNEVEP